MVWRSSCSIWETPHRLSISGYRCLSSHAVPGIRVCPGSLSLHGLEIVRRAGHVFKVQQRLKNYNNFAHQWSCFRVPAKTVVGQLSRLLCTSDWEVALKARINEPIKTPSFSKMRPSPLNQIVLPIRSVFVHGSSSCQHFKQDNPKAVHITLRRQMSCHQKILSD